MQMDDVVRAKWEKKLGKCGLSEAQLEQPSGDCSLTRFSANVEDSNHTDDLPGKYVALMYDRIMSAERLRVVSPARTTQNMRLHPPDEMGRPGQRAIDKRTSISVDCVWRKGSLAHVGRRRSYRIGKPSLSRTLEPDAIESLTWGTAGRTCSALHPSDEDWFWFKYAHDERWIPAMHEIVSIASAGGDDREWREKQINHSRGDRTGLGHSIDKIKHPTWAKRPETLAFALNQKFPDLEPGGKLPQDVVRLFDAMEVIWKRKETTLSESQRASMRKQLERFRQFGFGLSKSASSILANLLELLHGDLNDSLGDPGKIAFIALWHLGGVLE